MFLLFRGCGCPGGLYGRLPVDEELEKIEHFKKLYGKRRNLFGLRDFLFKGLKVVNCDGDTVIFELESIANG